MHRKTACVLIAAILLLPLCGCWNYRGLNEITIVSGVAIDRDPETGNYKFSYEVVDLNKPVKEHGLSTKIIESEGKTEFIAARNAKRRIINKLYFGHTQTVVISDEVARSVNISGLTDWFLRDGETRETACFVVSQEKTARDVIAAGGVGNVIVSNEIHEIIETDQKITSSTILVPINEMYNTLKSEGKDLVLPVIHKAENEGKPVNEANGTAVFHGEKLAGYLTPEETKYFLFATNKVKGGVLTIASDKKGPEDIALEISENKTKLTFTEENDKIRVKVQTKTIVFLGEAMKSIDAVDLKKIAELEAIAEKKLEANIGSVVKKAQSEFGADIFGFGSMIRKKDLKLWKRLKDTWDERFRSLKVEVRSDVRIVNTSYVKKR
jgi:spore germination protein KC